MLSIKRRVRKQSFVEIMKEGVFLHSPSFYLRFISKNDTSPSLFGFVVPNKVKKTSVGRHLIKRKISSIVEKVLLTVKPGYWVIIFTKKDVSALPLSKIEKEIIELLKEGKMLNEKQT